MTTLHASEHRTPMTARLDQILRRWLKAWLGYCQTINRAYAQRNQQWIDRR